MVATQKIAQLPFEKNMGMNTPTAVKVNTHGKGIKKIGGNSRNYHQLQNFNLTLNANRRWRINLKHRKGKKYFAHIVQFMHINFVIL